MSSNSRQVQLSNKIEETLEAYFQCAEAGPWPALDTIRKELPALPGSDQLIWDSLLTEIESYCRGPMRRECRALHVAFSRLGCVSGSARRSAIEVALRSIDEVWIPEVCNARSDIRDYIDEYEVGIIDSGKREAWSNLVNAIELHDFKAARTIWERCRPYLGPGADPIPNHLRTAEEHVVSTPLASGGNGKTIEDGPYEGFGYWCDGKLFELSKQQQLAFGLMWRRDQPVQESEFMEVVWGTNNETSDGNLRTFISRLNDRISDNGRMIMELYRKHGYIHKK